MRTKRYMEMRKVGEYTITVERIKHDIYGNPKYNISVFGKNNIFRGNWNEVSYNIDETIENLIKQIEK